MEFELKKLQALAEAKRHKKKPVDMDDDGDTDDAKRFGAPRAKKVADAERPSTKGAKADLEEARRHKAKALTDNEDPRVAAGEKKNGKAAALGAPDAKRVKVKAEPPVAVGKGKAAPAKGKGSLAKVEAAAAAYKGKK